MNTTSAASSPWLSSSSLGFSLLCPLSPWLLPSCISFPPVQPVHRTRTQTKPRTMGNGPGHPDSEAGEQHGERLRSSGEPRHSLRPRHKDDGSAGTTGTTERSKLGFGAGGGTWNWSGGVHCCHISVPPQDTAAFPLAKPSALNLTSQTRALVGLHPKLL